jgi:hypothetical protein
LKRLKEKWKQIRQTFAKIEADRQQRALDEWQKSHPKEYALWLAAGCPAIFICKT